MATSGGWTLSTDTLDLLFKLASSPDTIMEGLKLLHELQTHQVELEMQHQELERTLQQHDKQHTVYKTLFEHAPFAYLLVQADGLIVKSNTAATRLFVLKPHGCNGCRLDSLCEFSGSNGLDALFKQVDVEELEVMRVLDVKPALYRPKRVQLLISKAPESDHYLVALSNYDQLLKI